MTIPEMLDGHAAEHRAKAADEGRKATEARPLVEQAASILTARREHIEELEAQLTEIKAQLADARAGHEEATERHAAALAVVARHEAESQAHADVAEKVAALAEAARTPPAYDPDAALAATGLTPRDDEQQHTGGNGRVVPPPGEVEIVAPACVFCGEPLMPHGDAWLHCHGVRDHPAAPDDLVPPGAPVKDSRAEVAPHLPPPVPHDPAGPLMTMPDLAPRREPLDPPPGEGTHTHAKDRPGLFARLTGGHRTIRDEQDGDQADG